MVLINRACASLLLLSPRCTLGRLLAKWRLSTPILVSMARYPAQVVTTLRECGTSLGRELNPVGLLCISVKLVKRRPTDETPALSLRVCVLSVPPCPLTLLCLWAKGLTWCLPSKLRSRLLSPCRMRLLPLSEVVRQVIVSLANVPPRLDTHL